MGHNILAIDQGTTNTKALIIDPAGRILARGSQPTAISYPAAGLGGTGHAGDLALHLAAIEQLPRRLARPTRPGGRRDQQPARDGAGLGAGDGQAARPVRRVAMPSQRGHLQRPEGAGLGSILQERTGLQIDPMFSASKLRWLLDHIPDGQGATRRTGCVRATWTPGCSGT